MAAKIKADTLQALDAWKTGKPVRSIELGHVQRMLHSEEHLQSYPNTRPGIDLTQRVSNDQERAHAFVFDVVDWYAGHDGVWPDSFENFDITCNEILKKHPQVTTFERDAVISLAWKALLLGWKRAIDGFPEAHYIEVTNPAAVSAT